jgi:cytochrome c
MLGPPVKGVMYHMREEFNNDEDIEAHIQDFVLEPTLEKALCKSVRRFGLMPSQKDNVTKEELKIISEWMTKNFKITKEEYINSKKRH